MSTLNQNDIQVIARAATVLRCLDQLTDVAHQIRGTLIYEYLSVEGTGRAARYRHIAN